MSLIEELAAEMIEGCRPEVPRAGIGDVLVGEPGSTGTVRGRARVVIDPLLADDLEPGDVLVARFTDPSWTPLFLSAAAVVVSEDNQRSHAVILARELGIPCVVGLELATARLIEGSEIEVDGTIGTVTVLRHPDETFEPGELI